MSEHLLIILGIAASAATVLGVALTLWANLSPGFKRRAAADRAILGTEEVKDLGGGITTVGQPGLVHVTRENTKRLEKVEKAVTTLAEVLANQTELSARVDVHEARLNDVDSSIALIIADKIEHGADKAFATVEQKNADVITVEATEA